MKSLSESGEGREQGNDFDEHLQAALKEMSELVLDEIKRYPRDLYPARGTVLISLERRLDEVVSVAERLGEFPPYELNGNSAMDNFSGDTSG